MINGIDWLLIVIFAIVLCFSLVVIVGAPYVPTKKSFVKKAFSDLYKLSKNDLMVDIGSGDGIVLRYASNFGTRSIGYEINPILFFISKILSRHDSLVKIKCANFWLIKLPPETTVVYVFITTKDMNRLQKWLQMQTNHIGKSLTVISLGNQFTNPKPDCIVDPYNLYIFKPLQHNKAQV